MKNSFFLTALLLSSLAFATDSVESTEIIDMPEATAPTASNVVKNDPLLQENFNIHLSVIGQGVAPMNTTSPAQAFALAKRAAIADGYRLIAEKIKGVKVEGQDTIKNMMVKRSIVRTYVHAMVQNANIVETNFKDGLCEVEMEVTLSYADLAR